MRNVFRVLALVMCAAVAFQAAVVVWGFAGLGVWVEGGGVLDKAAMEAEGAPPFKEATGLMLHGMSGMMIIPILAILLVIASLFAKAMHARKMALIVLGLVALQMWLGLTLHSAPLAGLFHGINAMVLFCAALMAYWLARHPRETAGTQRVRDELDAPKVRARA